MTISFQLLLSKRFWISLIVILAVAVFFVLRSSTAQVILEALTPPDLPQQEIPDNRQTIAQNWSPEVSERFHFVSQGTSTLPIPYDWLLALEQAEPSPWGLLMPGGEEPLFTDPAYMERYGFISSEASIENPDGLPIGFASTSFQNLEGYPTTTTAVGFTCAACHTGRLTHDGTEYLIEGGPAVIDLQVFSKGLGAALGQTLFSASLSILPNKRFDRFARRVLGEAYSETAKAKLATDLGTVLEAGATQGDTIAVVEGFGRLDALNRIGNQVFSKNTGWADNYTPIDAPVNYPHIWTASWFDWVQYDGSIMQPLIRNAGESLGVHAALNITAPAESGRFSSSIPVQDMLWIESVLAGPVAPAEQEEFGGLLAPAWPDALGPIDAGLAEKGAALYTELCSGCHLPPLDSEAIWSDDYFKPITYTAMQRQQETDDKYLALNIIPISTLGTDPAQADILAHRTVNTAADPATGREAMGIDTTVCAPQPQYSGASGADSGYDTSSGEPDDKTPNELGPLTVRDGPMLSFAFALGAVVQQTNREWFRNNNVPFEFRASFEGDRPNCLQAGSAYKARPLNGIWATGPFLHNGSVPTLDDLLRPADERPRYVRLGDPAFDPVKVGVVQPDLTEDSYPTYVDGYFMLDTALAGNRNTGHGFGPMADGDKTGMVGPPLSDEDRAALIEYLKTL